jgi:uncharacterized repeat protein (TIGR03803 family)
MAPRNPVGLSGRFRQRQGITILNHEEGIFMTIITKSPSRLSSGAALVAAAVLVLASAASAQHKAVGLYEYPITSNNTYAITNTSLMAQGPDGNLYMTDQLDGEYGLGSVYNISPSGEFTSFYSFCAEGGGCVTTGALPDGGVTLGSDGNFYGTVQNGGTHGFGQVFKLTPEGVHTAVYNFTGANPGDGGAPDYPVFLATDGDLWGVQNVSTCGGLFKLTLKGVISNFPLAAPACDNGSIPNLPTEGSDGNFYGTTEEGGGSPCQPGCGVVYKATAAGKIKVLHAFQGPDGAFPQGVLVEGPDGNFWGVTEQYTAGIFKISSSGEFSAVHTFAGPPNDVDFPVAGLTLGSDGNFYGVAGGGSDGAGAIFEVTPAGDFSVLYSFPAAAGPPGFGPCTALFQSTNGKFYGNTCGNSLGDTGFFYSFDVGLPPFVRTSTQSGAVGAKVTFLGQDFTGATEVEFGGASATFKIISDTELTAVVPAAAVTGIVSVVTSSGTVTALRNFKVLPKIKSISPTSGPVGTVVTITGTGLTGATKVTVDGKAASFTQISSTEITVTVPSTANTGKITVTTAGGSASSATFTVT